MAISIFVNRSATRRFHFQLHDPADSSAVEDHFLDLRSELSANELSRLELSVLKQSRVNMTTGEAQLDIADYDALRVAAWVKSWSFSGPSGEQMPPTFDNVRSIAKPIFDSVLAIVDEHSEGVERDRARDENPTESRAVPGVSTTASETAASSSIPRPAAPGISSPPPAASGNAGSESVSASSS